MRAMILVGLGGLLAACAAPRRPPGRVMAPLALATPARPVPVPTVAGSAAVASPSAGLDPAAWALEGGAAWSASGALTAQVCCTGWLKASRTLDLPAGGAIEVDAVAPCHRGLAVAVRGVGPTLWAGGAPDPTPFSGTVTLVVPPSASPRVLEIYAEGGLHCCGAVRIDAVRIRGPR